MSGPIRCMVALLGLSVAGSAVPAVEAQHHAGGGAGMACRMNQVSPDSVAGARMRGMHELVMHRERISRSVTNLPNGIRTVTESDDPRLARLIREYVPILEQHATAGQEIHTTVDTTARGTILMQWSDDPATAAALQQHAALVSGLLRGEQATRHPAGHACGMAETATACGMNRMHDMHRSHGMHQMHGMHRMHGMRPKQPVAPRP